MKKIMNNILLPLVLISAGTISCMERTQTNVTADVVFSQIEDGPLKDKMLNPTRGWFFKTNDEKAAEYILDVLLKSGSEEGNKPMTSCSGYWGGWFEMMGLAANNARMKAAIRQLLGQEPDEVKWQEYDKISKAQSKIVTIFKENKQRLAEEICQKEKAATTGRGHF